MLRAIGVLFFAGCAFLAGIWTMRRLRRSIDAEADLDSAETPALEAMPHHLYGKVIQQLKQQKHELLVQTQAEQRRARVTENFSQAVLSHLTSGVLVFDLNGLVKQSNPAAREILGFASPSGMSAETIFRTAEITLPDSSATGVFPDGTSEVSSSLAEEVHCVLREDSHCRRVEARYRTPGGSERYLSVTVSPVPAIDGHLLGAACLINDLSAMEQIRRQQELQGEISAEMALELRTSLATIAGYAQQLARNRDPDLAQQLAADIAAEASRLDRNIGGFLARRPAALGVTAQAAAHGGSKH
jgi:nitrogen fixation/metabolism regulation signal transduction histidine kinase